MPSSIYSCDEVRARREACGLTRQELAQLADCSIAHLADLERGRAPKRSKVLKRVLRVLDDGSTHSEAPAVTPGPREKSAVEAAAHGAGS